MKKSTALISTLSLILTLSSCTLPWQKNTPETETIVEDTTNVDNITPPAAEPEKFTDITPGDTPKAIAQGGVYLPYTSTAVAQAMGDIVLFFYANWCPTCGVINKDIQSKNTEIPKNLTILKVNYDDAMELKKLYEVTVQHTFVQVDNTGKMIKKWRGGSSLSNILEQADLSKITDPEETIIPETKEETAS